MFNTRIPSTVSFAVAILLFFLPFAQVKCGGSVLAENSGFGIAIGSSWKAAGENLFGNIDPEEKKIDKEKSQDPNIYAIIALGLGVLGLLFCFGKAKTAGIAGMVCGLLAAGALIGLFFDLKKLMNSQSAKMNKPEVPKDLFGLGNMNNMIPTLELTPWFFISGIAFFAAAAFCFRRWQSANKPGLNP